MGPSGIGGPNNPRPNNGDWTAGETNTSICGFSCPGGKVHPNEAQAFYENYSPSCPSCALAIPPAVACSACAYGVNGETCSSHASSGPQQTTSPTIAQAFCSTAETFAYLCDSTIAAASSDPIVPSSSAKTYVATQLMSKPAGRFSIGATHVRNYCPSECPSAPEPEPEPAVVTPTRASHSSRATVMAAVLCIMVSVITIDGF